MPIVNYVLAHDELPDPDTVPRPVVAYGVVLEHFDHLELEAHQHRRCQLLLVMQGVLSCEVEGDLWLVPPQSAIWMPGNVVHSVKAVGAFEGYNLFVDPAVATALPSQCCIVGATPLLRELLIRAAGFPVLYPEGGTESRLVSLLLDEIGSAPSGNLHLPMPKDRRLRKMAEQLMAHPEDRGTLESWAQRIGLSERTLARTLSRETGMSFGRWRQQLNIMLALQWLAKGTSIQQAAADLGYESAGSFVTMFRKALGTSPGRYMAQRRASPTLEDELVH